MSGDEITLDDLLAEEPGNCVPPTSFRQLLADGLPRGCGLAGLAATIERMQDSGPEFAAVRLEYLRLLEAQRRPVPNIN